MGRGALFLLEDVVVEPGERIVLRIVLLDAKIVFEDVSLCLI